MHTGQSLARRDHRRGCRSGNFGLAQSTVSLQLIGPADGTARERRLDHTHEAVLDKRCQGPGTLPRSRPPAPPMPPCPVTTGGCHVVPCGAGRPARRSPCGSPARTVPVPWPSPPPPSVYACIEAPAPQPPKTTQAPQQPNERATSATTLAGGRIRATEATILTDARRQKVSRVLEVVPESTTREGLGTRR